MRRRGLILILVAVLLAARVSAQEPPLPAGLEEAPAATTPADSGEPALPAGLESGGEPELPPGLGGGTEPSLPLGLESTPLPVSEPGLPAGLEPTPAPPSLSEPGLPAGLASPEPSLPAGLDRAPAPVTKPESTLRDLLPFDLSGFLEARGGLRTRDDPTQKDVSIAEMRLHLQAVKAWENVQVNVTGDFLYDGVPSKLTVDLERGEGWFDLREANVLYRASAFADIKLGRQVLTWGTGDLVFINDLFPKDWNSFFIGRDEEYLKAPSDALKLSLFPGGVNIDVVYTPRFDHDRFIDGRRISYFNANAGQVVGRNLPVDVNERDDAFEDDEWALRLYRNLGGFEVALYGYRGYWKSPNGFDAGTGRFTFPGLSVYGASVRGPVAHGIGHLEIGYYDSREDSRGNDPLVRNSEFRLLAGYERELLPELTGGVQYYLERMVRHNAYRANLPPGFPVVDENRHVITVRLTRLLMNQNLTLSLFNFYSPSDGDGYARPRATYKISDHWRGEIGGNIFYGSRNHTFFGQFQDNSNVYLALRYGF